MTVAELRKLLEGVPDNIEVVVFDQQRLGSWTTANSAIQFDVLYLGNGTWKHNLPGIAGESERVFIIQ